MYKILISGYYGFNNIGDESILRIVVESLRSHIDDIEITILSHNPQDTAEKYGVKAVNRMSLPTIIKSVKNCDLLISGGGSLLQDVTSSNSIRYYLFIIRLAQLFGKKTVLYSQGIGPINKQKNRKLVASCLKKVDEIAVRDESSADLLAEIGIDRNRVAITADPVMAIKKANLDIGKHILEELGCKKEANRKVVGWAIKSADMSPAFLGEIEKSIRWLKQEYNTVSVLIPFHYEQDAIVVSELQDKLKDEAFSISEKYLTEEMLSIIGNLDYLVGVRLHSLIFAAVMEVPSLAISYDPKVTSFMESIGRSCISKTDDFSCEKFKTAYTELIANEHRILAETNVHVQELQLRLENNHQMIQRVLMNPAQDDTVPDESTDKPANTEDTPKSSSNKKKRGIAAAIGGVMSVTILAKLFGILREAIQANVFGTADAFYAAYNKTIYLFTTIAYAMCIAAVPIITKKLHKNRNEGISAANNLITFSLILSLFVLLIWEITTLAPFAQTVWSPAFPELLSYIRIMLLTLPVIIVTYLLVAVFQSMDHFALQGSMSLPYSLFLIGYLLLWGEKYSIFAYVIAVAAAWLLQFAMTVPYGIKERYRYVPCFHFREDYIKTFLKTALVTIITGSAYLFCYLTDASHAELMGEGTTTAFYYADKLFTPLVTTFIYSIGAVLFPKLSREFVTSNPQKYKEYVWHITSSTVIIVFPICAILLVLGEPIVKVLFESGNFTAEATVETAKVLMMYLLGMAGFCVIDLLNKAFISMNRLRVPLLVSIGMVVLNILLDQFASGSTNALALSTAFTMTVGAVATMIAIFRKANVFRLWPLLKSAVAAFIMMYGMMIAKGFLFFADDGKLTMVLKGCCLGAVGMAVFFGLCFLFRIKEITVPIKQKFIH